ncbi:MAG: YIP1 family protein [Oscillospiraceae bacterium]|nr:YIP1 family protein [Oscillospiraceae bacterium]
MFGTNKQIWSFLIAFLLLFQLFLIPSVGAREDGLAYVTYYYDALNDPKETAPAYLPTAVITGESLGLDGFLEPSDLSVSEDGSIWLLDSGNGRIVLLDSGLKNPKVIQPVDQKGEAISFTNLTGIAVRQNPSWIVLTDKMQGVYVLDHEGKLLRQLDPPAKNLVAEDFVFAPLKAEFDETGILYVILENCYMGALQYDETGKYLGFFGSEKVDMSGKAILNRFWKKILPEEMANKMARSVPVEFVSFCMDEDGFLYTVRKGNDASVGQVKCLNALGENVLPEKPYGDIGTTLQLADVTVDELGFITVLDSGSGRMLQYDSEGELLYAFGGKGSQKGLALDPVAVAACDAGLLLLDKTGGRLTLFTPTSFGEDVRQAVSLCAKGLYAQAKLPWERVLHRDASYAPANRGLGKASEGQGDDAAAMNYYRAAGEQELYGEAFGSLRDAFLQANFGAIMGSLCVVCVLLAIFSAWRKKHAKTLYELQMPVWKYPFYCMIHPLVGYEDMKERKKDSWKVTAFLLIALFLTAVIQASWTGFAFRTSMQERFSLVEIFLSTIGLYLLFVVCNWAITTVNDGKGRLLEVANYTAAALTPYILGSLVMILLSNLLAAEEAVFYSLLQVILLLWTGLCLFMATKEVHMYSFWKNVWLLVLTLVGMVVLIVLCALAYDVVTQLLEFISSLVTEMKLML